MPRKGPLPEEDSTAYPVAFSPNGQVLACGGRDKNIKLWDVASGKKLNTLKGRASGVFSLAFHPDGKILASGGPDHTVKLWDVKKGKNLTTLRTGHTDTIVSLAFSPDGKILASGSQDNSITLWDVKESKKFATLKGHTAHVWSVAFSRDGKTLASASVDNTVKLWEIPSGKNTTTLKGDVLGEFSTVAFSPDGKLLASAGGLDKSGSVRQQKQGRRRNVNVVHFLLWLETVKRLRTKGFDPTDRSTWTDEMWEHITTQMRDYMNTNREIRRNKERMQGG